MEKKQEAEFNIFLADRLGKYMSNYDMAIEAFKYFYNKKCENCANYADTEDEGFWCEEFESSFININERPENFGCNKWESK